MKPVAVVAYRVTRLVRVTLGKGEPRVREGLAALIGGVAAMLALPATESLNAVAPAFLLLAWVSAFGGFFFLATGFGEVARWTLREIREEWVPRSPILVRNPLYRRRPRATQRTPMGSLDLQKAIETDEKALARITRRLGEDIEFGTRVIDKATARILALPNPTPIDWELKTYRWYGRNMAAYAARLERRQAAMRPILDRLIQNYRELVRADPYLNTDDLVSHLGGIGEAAREERDALIRARYGTIALRERNRQQTTNEALDRIARVQASFIADLDALLSLSRDVLGTATNSARIAA